MTKQNAEKALCDGNLTGQGTANVDKKKTREFKEPVGDCEIVKMERKRFAPESYKKMKWAMKMYQEWRSARLSDGLVPVEIVRADLCKVWQFGDSDLSFSLSRFIREVKKIDGKDFPPNSVREIIIMIQMFLNSCGLDWKLLEGCNFVNLRNVVDNTMKERHAEGLGIRKSAEIISLRQENLLFESGALGEETPVQLVRTVIYMLGLHLALRGGIEHNKLRRPGFECQISVEMDDKNRERLVYREDPLQKTNQGGLMSKRNNKIVYVYSASERTRCPVALFKKYVRLLPNGRSCKKLYLRPKVKFTPSTWYNDQPYGCNRVANCVKESCEMAGIVGKYMNHSLRATSASRMFDNKVSEQVIKEVTGHKSDCVRVYKRTSDEIRKEASEKISGQNEINEDIVLCLDTECVHEKKCEGSEDKSEGNLSFDQMVRNVKITKAALARKKFCKKYKKAPVNSKIVKKNMGRKKVKRPGFVVKNKQQRFVIDLNVNVKVKK